MTHMDKRRVWLDSLKAGDEVATLDGQIGRVAKRTKKWIKLDDGDTFNAETGRENGNSFRPRYLEAADDIRRRDTFARLRKAIDSVDYPTAVAILKLIDDDALAAKGGTP